MEAGFQVILKFIAGSCIFVFMFGYISYYGSSGGRSFQVPSPIQHVPPLTIHLNTGRLGNQMFTFATLYGLATLNDRDIAIMPKNYEVLSEYFDIKYPLINPYTFVESDPHKIGNWLKEEDRDIPLTTNIVKGNYYPTSFTFFDHCREGIRKLFTFRPAVREHARKVLKELKKDPWTNIFVGVHVRRGDYLSKSAVGWLRAYQGREVDLLFFQKATKYFTDKYKNVTFVAVSDDRTWCREKLSKFGILTAPDSPSAGHDLALLSQCNHTIMTYGTYGFWGGYLSGGEVVYFRDFIKPDTSFAKNYFVFDKMYPTSWVGISTAPPGYWKSYTNPFNK